MNSEDGQTADARAKNFRMSEYEENVGMDIHGVL